MRVMETRPGASLGRIGPFLLVGVAVAMLPSFANGESVAYVLFFVGAVLAFAPAAIVARKSSSTTPPDRSTSFGVTAIVGGVLIVSSVHEPPLQTGVLGIIVGVILAFAIFFPRRKQVDSPTKT
jgi:hypothetical protein